MASTDRFELRLFGRDLSRAADALVAMAESREAGEAGLSREAYLLRRRELRHNLKARNGKLELKTLVEMQGGLQRWHPQVTLALPEAAEDPAAGTARREPLPAIVVELLGPALRTEPGVQPQLPADLSALAARLDADGGRTIVHVVKRRRRLALGEVQGEVVDLAVNGAGLHSVALECEDPEKLRATAVAAGLDGAENVSYLLALHRLLGWQPLPDDSPDRAWPAAPARPSSADR